MINENNIDRIIGKVLLEANNNREAAGYAGDMGDRGASTLEMAVKYFRYGWNKQLPPEWQEYADQAKKESDPEWGEFQRLSAKFRK
jgi:hypothetical protein